MKLIVFYLFTLSYLLRLKFLESGTQRILIDTAFAKSNVNKSDDSRPSNLVEMLFQHFIFRLRY